MKLKIDVVTYSVDQQDGSFAISAYNSVKELAKHRDFNKKKIDKILSEDDPYENGTIGKDTIEIEVVDGVAKLVGHLTFTSD